MKWNYYDTAATHWYNEILARYGLDGKTVDILTAPKKVINAFFCLFFFCKSKFDLFRKKTKQTNVKFSKKLLKKTAVYLFGLKYIHPLLYFFFERAGSPILPRSNISILSYAFLKFLVKTITFCSYFENQKFFCRYIRSYYLHKINAFTVNFQNSENFTTIIHQR